MVAYNLEESKALADPALLDKIDKLFKCNVGEYIIFRRAEGGERKISALIIPGPDINNEEHISRLKEWAFNNIQSLSPASFLRMIKEVHDLMGLSITKDDGLPMFSKSVLKLEICGLTKDYLSVINIPDNKTMVQDMVHGYIKNPRSIILTVVPVNIDIITQEIIKMARELDPEGERTLGVITKPDLVDKGTETKLGWVILRNPGQIEMQDGNPDRGNLEEKLCSQHLWTLCTYLQEIVTVNAWQAFPLYQVCLEIGKRLRSSLEALQALGIENDIFIENMAWWGHEFNFGVYDKEVLDIPKSTYSDDLLNIKLLGPFQYQESWGFEIGIFNPILLSTIMKKQLLKWTALVNGYISNLVVIVHSFIVTALNLACLDTQLLDRYKKAVDKVEFLLHKCQEEWHVSKIEEKAFDNCLYGKVVRVEDLAYQQHISNMTYTVQDISDILCSYYKVARKRFVDNICMQAAGYYLVNGPETPMKLFSPLLVTCLTSEQLEEIAGEDALLKQKQ
ncbi:hypothetical protein BJY01DRAFT_234510 [Aspergillus pseudoustus]|uniref:GED domain-containing protein n=1 Tax=Aspergillus pseudoustus TaxID=1810923 RepID=A0ABR4K332_9EURO